ncbi:DUF6765 family protein [Runella slithyformis]|uniref:Uncharacterized protein n=1 Tax=Runella slithyformis (strain ATCC 29530 / DSM 19594 / LMG 11500 / NCIMB 11436 / LSU 4) TaxID=761193 RepID=A0A7U3ZQH7_RUNSL|nr:DUF6765 family protein [Runella slithyformis]AEI51516.1 hypothetical protein Runsl_5216 [Runella slithyformis DSM 19594]
MEESGHYYTVYFVSLAVGFTNERSHEYAFYTQMPDEVEEFDAAFLEKKQFKNAGKFHAAKQALKIAYSQLFPFTPMGVGALEESLARQEKILAKANQWRMIVELGLHSLTGKSAKDEQDKTAKLLKSTKPDNMVRFGFLLHRYGDTFAHSRMDNPSKLYDTSENISSPTHRGHMLDGTHADHPWERETLYFQYVEGLYDILSTAKEKSRNDIGSTRRGKVLALHEIKNTLKRAINEARMWSENEIKNYNAIDTTRCKPAIASGLFDACKKPEEAAQLFFSEIIRREVFFTLGINIHSYTPERNETVSLKQFLDPKNGYMNGISSAYSSEQLEKEIYKLLEEASGK